MAEKQSRIAILLDLNAKGFDAQLARAQRDLRRFGSQMKSVGRGMSLAVTAPLLAVGGASIKLAIDFEKAMAKVQAISGATKTEFDSLSASARHFGATTAFTASEVASLQLELSKLGFKPQQIENATQGILGLAFAFDNELAETAVTTASTLNQFGLGAEKTGEVADIMAASFSNSALDLENFGEAMKNAGPIARAAGLDVGETSAILGILANNGIKGADAGTKLKIALTEIQIAGLPVRDTIQKIVAGTFSFDEAVALLGKRAQILNPILSSNAKELEKLTKAIEGSEGSLDAARAIMEDTTDGALKRMNSALQAAGESFGKTLLPMVADAAEGIASLAKWFESLSPATKGVIAAVGGLLAVVGPLLFLIGTMATGIAAALPVLAALAGGIAAVGAAVVAAPLAPLAVGAAAAYLSWTTLSDAFEKRRNTVSELDHSAQRLAESMRLVERSFQDVNEMGLDEVEVQVSGTEKEIKRLQDLQGDLLSDPMSVWGNFDDDSDYDPQAALQRTSDIKSLAAQLLNLKERRDELIAQKKIADAAASEDAAVRETEKLTEAVAKAIKNYEELVLTAAKYQELGIKTEVGDRLKETEGSLLRIIDAQILAGADASKWADQLASVRDRMEEVTAMEEITETGAALRAGRTGAGVPTDTPEATLQTPQDLEAINAAAVQANVNYGALATTIRSMKDALADSVDIANVFSSALQGAFQQIFTGAKSAGQALLEMAANVLGAIAAQVSALMIQAAVQTALAGGPAAMVIAPALIGVGLGIASAAMASVPAFAEGGAVLGPTLALVGEKPGSKGEAIIPFEKIGQFVDQVAPQSGGDITVHGSISGADIALSSHRGGVQRSRRR